MSILIFMPELVQMCIHKHVYIRTVETEDCTSLEVGHTHDTATEEGVALSPVIYSRYI